MTDDDRRNPLTREDIVNWADCPECGSTRGMRCVTWFGEERHRNHFGRMRAAQFTVRAVRPEPLHVVQATLLGVSLLGILVAAGVLYALLLVHSLGYARDVLIPAPAPTFTPTQLDTLPLGATRLDVQP